MATIDTFVPELPGGTGGVAVDRQGAVFVADFGAVLGDTATMGRRIFRIDARGRAEVFAEGFEGASGNVFDAHGVLYQSNIRGGFISSVSPDGTTRVVASEGIRSPVGVAVDGEGTLYVANCNDNTIQRVDRAGTSQVYCADPLLVGPNGVTIDAEGNLYVANFENGDVVRIRPDGSASRLATVPGGNNGHLVLHEGRLLVVARSAHRLYSVTFEGEVTVFAGTGERGCQDGPALEASLSLPNDIGIAPDGRTLYVDEIAATGGDPHQLAPMRIRRIRLDQ